MRIEVQNFIEKITRSSRATDKEGLCIISGKLVWSVTVSMHLLNDDGNSFDAFFLAAILALKNTRLPEVSMTRDKLKINDSKLKYVNVHHIPISTTFYFMKDIPDTPIIDVTSKEERLCTSRLSIVMNSYEDICGMCTLGALNIASNNQEEDGQSDEDMAVTNPLHSAALFECMEVALKKTKEITEIVRTSWDKKDKHFSLLDIGF
jgi:exosome complex component RRP45